jgi:hypothetical protein
MYLVEVTVGCGYQLGKNASATTYTAHRRYSTDLFSHNELLELHPRMP